MGIAVYNISATSARVSWPSSPSCLDTFYSVMYDPNWNSLLMGYKRKSFMHEERIPVSQTSTHLANLLPQTAYFLCVTCQAANPVRDQCQVFSTLSDGSEAHDRAGWELAMGVWLTCCILLLVIAGILLWGCLHTILTALLNFKSPISLAMRFRHHVIGLWHVLLYQATLLSDLIHIYLLLFWIRGEATSSSSSSACQRALNFNLATVSTCTCFVI
uniref:Fibronectin type-III domain-containing protein n=1 Tax=Sander lucioperca TaxID=283035 RepID=A0A8D0D6M2_SANLU